MNTGFHAKMKVKTESTDANEIQEQIFWQKILH